MRKAVYVPIEDEEREQLVKYLKKIAFDYAVGADNDEEYGQVKDAVKARAVERKANLFIERIEGKVPLTIADIKACLKVTGLLSRHHMMELGWEPSMSISVQDAALLQEAQYATLYQTLLWRCENKRRIAETGQSEQVLQKEQDDENAA